MKNIKQTTLALTIAAVLATSGSATHATGFPTVDIAAIATSAIEYAEVIEKWAKQYQQMKDTFQSSTAIQMATNGSFNLHDVMGNAELLAYLPDDAIDVYNMAMDNDLGALFGKALNVYEKTLVRDTCADKTTAIAVENCEELRGSSYQMQQTSSQVYESVMKKAKRLDELKGKLAASDTVKLVADVTALINSETASIQNESIKLEAVNLAYESQRQILLEQQAQIASQVYDLPNATFEPIKFGVIE